MAGLTPIIVAGIVFSVAYVGEVAIAYVAISALARITEKIIDRK